MAIPLLTDFGPMRQAGALAAATLDYITPFVKEGVTTQELDTLCHAFMVQNGAQPAPPECGFPASICTSVNHVVCHGIPNHRPLAKGDVLNIDVSLCLEGWYGDTGRMFWIPPVHPSVIRCMRVTYQALQKAIACVRPGIRLGDIGSQLQHDIESAGFSVVREFCGHGIGQKLHQAPEVTHFGRKGEGVLLEEGMCFTIEPMVNMGRKEVKVLQDGWTAVTKDRSISTQYEHILGVTATGCEVFTLSPLVCAP